MSIMIVLPYWSRQQAFLHSKSNRFPNYFSFTLNSSCRARNVGKGNLLSSLLSLVAGVPFQTAGEIGKDSCLYSI